MLWSKPSGRFWHLERRTLLFLLSRHWTKTTCQASVFCCKFSLMTTSQSKNGVFQELRWLQLGLNTKSTVMSPEHFLRFLRLDEMCTSLYSQKSGCRYKSLNWQSLILRQLPLSVWSLASTIKVLHTIWYYSAIKRNYWSMQQIGLTSRELWSGKKK